MPCCLLRSTNTGAANDSSGELVVLTRPQTSMETYCANAKKMMVQFRKDLRVPCPN